MHVRYCQIKFQPCLTLQFLSLVSVDSTLKTFANRCPTLYRYIHISHLSDTTSLPHTMMNFERTGGQTVHSGTALIKNEAYKPCEGRG